MVLPVQIELVGTNFGDQYVLVGFLYHSFSGHLVMSCNNSLFVELIDFLLAELAKNATMSTTRTYIQCIGAIR